MLAFLLNDAPVNTAINVDSKDALASLVRVARHRNNVVFTVIGGYSLVHSRIISLESCAEAPSIHCHYL